MSSDVSSIAKTHVKDTVLITDLLIKNDMRTNKELLELLLNNMNIFATNNLGGLCTLAFSLYVIDVITHKELTKVRKYIINNKPKGWYEFRPFYWYRGEVTSRAEFLMKHIKKQSTLRGVVWYRIKLFINLIIFNLKQS